MSNAGKKRYWHCANQEHYYDDFVNTHLCHSANRRENECRYPGIFRQQECPLFERGETSVFLKPEKKAKMSLDDAIRHCEEVAETQKCSNCGCAAEHIQLAQWLKELRCLRKTSTQKRKSS